MAQSLGWYCDIREHVHSTEQEADWCLALYERYQDARYLLNDRTREDQVAVQVNEMLLAHEDEADDR